MTDPFQDSTEQIETLVRLHGAEKILTDLAGAIGSLKATESMEYHNRVCDRVSQKIASLLSDSDVRDLVQRGY